MVHHSIEVVFTSFLTNFVEFYKSEVQLRRISITRTRVNKGKRLVRAAAPKGDGDDRHPENRHTKKLVT